MRVVVTCLMAACVAQRGLAQADVEMLFAAPANNFTESLPLGNGRLGAMVFGGTNTERIVLNEISMWSGRIQQANRTDAHQYLQPIQQLLLEGKNLEAQRILEKYFVCAGRGTGNGSGGKLKYGCYQTLGDCWIRYADTMGAVTNYKRTLRLDSATGKVSWTRNGTTFVEQVLVSAPQQAIIIHLKSSSPHALQFITGLSRKERATTRVTGASIEMKGSLDGGDGDEGIRYATNLRIALTDGILSRSDTGLVVTGATECMIVITAATDMNWPRVETRGADPIIQTRQQAVAAAAVAWKSILKTHVADYDNYFNRCSIRLHDSSYFSQLPVSDRLQQMANGKSDAAMVSLYFNFGRYLLISSSRTSLPANLQGLWAEEYQTPWNGDYHTNINIQMNYWLTGQAGLPECDLPIWHLLGQMSRYGEQTARAYYGAAGWVTHAITNPWGFTAPGEGAQWGSSVTGGAWLATHIWTHYQFYPDTNFLRKYYPILKGSARFFTNMLIVEPTHQWLVTAPSNSPENAYLLPDGKEGSTCMGPSIDMQIARQLLTATAAAARILGTDRLLADSLQKMVAQLAPVQVSPTTGAIQEWLEDYTEPEPDHRHLSPLYGLYPYDEINPWTSPVLAAAAKQTLLRRGDEGTGWSRAWKIALWARLGDGSHAYKMLQELWKPAGNDLASFNFSAAGTYPNLFDACPPFQIDGNLGATAAIMELFLQSHGPDQIIRLLPALPADAIFNSGHATGLHAKGGFILDMDWTQRKISQVKLYARYGGICRLAFNGDITVRDKKGRHIKTFTSAGTVHFNTRKGEVYTVRPK